MAIETVAQARDAIDAGQTWTGYFRRAGPYMNANVMTDLSYAAGIPVANYYAATPLTSAVLSGADGINTGPAPASGMSKYLRRVMMIPGTANGIIAFEMIDVVMFYPFIDGDGGQQDLFNTVPIPRYAGHNCRVMVVGQGQGTGNVSCQMTYTNSLGVDGRVSNFTMNMNLSPGTLYSSFSPGSNVMNAPGAYAPLQAGDAGVRSIERVDCLTAGGGIAAFVIVKPLMSFCMFENTAAPIEVDCLADKSFKLPQIENGAYLSILGRGTVGATQGVMIAEVETIWG